MLRVYYCDDKRWCFKLRNEQNASKSQKTKGFPYFSSSKCKI